MSFTIQNGILVKYIGTHTSVTIPEGVIAIEDDAFRKKPMLTNVMLPSSLRSIGKHAFAECSSLQCVTVREGLTDIGEEAFANCPLLSMITLPSSITRIGPYAFRGCRIKNIELPENVTTVGIGAFESCANLQKVIINNGLTSISGFTFAFCSRLSEVVIPESVTTIGADAFLQTAIKTLVIPESVKFIGNAAFEECRNLESIEIPDGVQTISSNTFSGCIRLKHIELPDSITCIEDSAFANCESLTRFVLPPEVTGISGRLFYECMNLTEVALHDNVKSIGKSAFWKCEKLESISVPDSVERIGSYAFVGCFGLADDSGNIVINKVFFGCKPDIRNAVVPEGVKEIADKAVYLNDELVSIAVPGSVEKINIEAFRRPKTSRELKIIIRNVSLLPANSKFSAILGLPNIYSKCTTQEKKKYVTIIKKNTSKLKEYAIADPRILQILLENNCLQPDMIDKYFEEAVKQDVVESRAMLMPLMNSQSFNLDLDLGSDLEPDEDEIVFGMGIKDKRIAISGDFRTISHKGMKILIDKHGGIFTTSVSEKTDYLVSAGRNREKDNLARSIGIRIISEDEFFIMIGVRMPKF